MMHPRVLGSIGMLLLAGLSFDAEPVLAQPFVPSNFELTVPDTYEGIDQNFLYLSVIAAQLTSDVINLDFASATANVPGGILYEDGPDRRVLMGLRNGVCFAAFAEPAGTTSAADVTPSPLGAIVSPGTCGPELCCPTTLAIRDDLFQASYYDELIATIQGCNSLCNKPGGCGVVLTGLGIGGAIAQTASLALAPSIRPMVITFGSPAPQQLPCEGIDPTRLYRFINTQAVLDGFLTYDPVPYVELSEGNKHQGRAFVIPPSLGPMATYYGDEALTIDQAFWADDTNFGNFGAVHSADAYLSRLLEYASFSNSIPTIGFLVGTPCIDTSECLFPNSCDFFRPFRASCGFVPGVIPPTRSPSQAPAPTRGPVRPPTPAPTPPPTLAPVPPPTPAPVPPPTPAPVPPPTPAPVPPPTPAPVPPPTPSPVPPPTLAPVTSFFTAAPVAAVPTAPPGPTAPPISNFIIALLPQLIAESERDVGLTENGGD